MVESITRIKSLAGDGANHAIYLLSFTDSDRLCDLFSEIKGSDRIGTDWLNTSFL
jgi:hypothetical protein